MKQRFRLTFPHERITEPVMCEIARQFDVMYSIRRANVDLHSGWIDLEFSGDEAEIEKVIAHLEERDVRVDPIGGDIVAG